MLSQVIKKTVLIPAQNQGLFKSCYIKAISVKRRLRIYIVYTMQIWNEYVTTILPLFSNPKTIVHSQSEVGPQSAFYTPLTKVRFN